jgi:hypothetical protein
MERLDIELARLYMRVPYLLGLKVRSNIPINVNFDLSILVTLTFQMVFDCVFDTLFLLDISTNVTVVQEDLEFMHPRNPASEWLGTRPRTRPSRLEIFRDG